MPETRPGIYIVESLSFDDEKAERFEGRVLAAHLRLIGLKHEYVYFRTRQELAAILARFQRSGFRYLHLSCHGNSDSIGLTLDDIKLRDLAIQLGAVLDGRRLFLSACSATTRVFAQTLFGVAPRCYSVVGPAKDIYFHDAAIFWASFYHLMLADDQTLMRTGEMKTAIQGLGRLYRTPITCFFRPRDGRMERFRYPSLPRAALRRWQRRRARK